MDQNKNGHTVFRCKYCGNVINPDNMFCPSCGAPITFMNHPNQSVHDQKTDSMNRSSASKPAGDLDDLPVINTDDIFNDLDYSSHINTNFEQKQEDDLPVIDVDGLFDDVPFADTGSYKNTVNQYYNMNHEKAAAAQPTQQQVQREKPAEPLNQAERTPVMEQRPVAEKKAAEPKKAQPERKTQVQPAPSKEKQMEEKAPEKPKKKKKSKKIFLFLLLAIAAGILAWYFAVYKNGTRADLLDLCTIKFTGVNGNGNIELTFNERCDLYDDFAVVDNNAACEELKKITFTATPNTGLSNGDTVTIRANYSNVDLAKYKIKVINDSKQVVVSGLDSTASYDLFSGVTVSFDGVDGYGKANVDASRCDEFAKANVTYSFEGKSENLKNGDTVVLKAEVDDSVLKKNHYNVTSKKKDYIVEGLAGTQEYDVFKNMSIKYSGASPRLSLSIDTSSCIDFVKKSVKFSLSDTKEVAVGDKITITASFNDDEAKKAGYKITTKTRTFTVENVSSYLSLVTSGQSNTLTSVLTDYLTKGKSQNGNSYFFDQDLDTLFNDGNTYTYKSAKEAVAARYFLYNEDKKSINSYLLVLKYTVSAYCEETKKIEEKVLYAESSVSNVYLAEDLTALKYDTPSEIVTDQELDYFISEVNSSGYKITKLK